MENKYNMTVEDNIDFAKRIIVDSIYREARVEGINVTFPETQQLYDGFSLPGFTYEDATKIINLKRTWFFILDTLEYPFDFRYLRHINGLIENNLLSRAGVIRDINVCISGTEWRPDIPSPDIIEKQLKQSLSINNPTERALDLMLLIMRGQYFEDGNKRTAQLAANHELIKNGCGIVSIPVDKRIEFSELLVSYYETGLKNEIMDFLYDNCLSGFSRENPLSAEEIERQNAEDEEMIRAFVRNNCR